MVKFRTGIELFKGKNMMYIWDIITMALLKIQTLFMKIGKQHKVMEHTKRINLLVKWPDLSKVGKVQSASKVKENVDQLRRLSSSGHFSSYGGHGLHGTDFWANIKTSKPISGLF